MKQQSTKNAIRESFLKLLSQRTFDKITVKSIVEDCGLTRNTFYYYYEDTYDILDDILTQAITDYSKRASEEGDIKKLIEEFCAFAEENPALVSHILKSTKWDEIKIYVLKSIDRGVDLMIDKYAQGRVVVPENRAIIKAVYRAAFGGLLESWLRRGIVKGLGEKVEILDGLFGDCIKNAVEKSVLK